MREADIDSDAAQRNFTEFSVPNSYQTYVLMKIGSAISADELDLRLAAFATQRNRRSLGRACSDHRSAATFP
jgi:hypothetical protein